MKTPRLLTLLLICLLGGHEAKSQSADDIQMARAKAIKLDLIFIDASCDKLTMDKELRGGTKITQAEWLAAGVTEYKPGSPQLKATGKNLFGESYGDQVAGETPTVPPKTWEAIKDVPIDWGDYKPKVAK